MNLVRKRKTKDPCQKCFLHKDLCICDLIPKIETQTKLSLIIHAKELKRTTNTGRLATHALINSEIFIRGQKNDVLDMEKLLSDQFESILFFPSDDAIDISEYIRQTSKPIQLIVPDGNWRQAGKVNTRYRAMKDLPRVKVSANNLNEQHLRKEHMPEGMATLEAIAAAYAVLEGPNIGTELQRLYEAKLRATLRGRGQLNKT